MGLDITAYSRLTRVGLHTADWAECEDGTHIQAFAYDSFPQSFDGIEVAHKENRLLVGGCYAVTDRTARHGFRAGSYSGYGAWRNDLQRQFNPDRHPDRPFYELIWFADNEGAIGPAAAGRLLADFREHTDRYHAASPWFAERYADWTRAAELAADGGLIDFH